MSNSRNSAPEASPPATRSEERRTFLFLAVFLAPLVSSILVGGLGFAIWMSRIIAGLPAR